MPDISMCSNEECPSRKDCYRYMAIPNTPYQSYANFTVAVGRERCRHFMEIWNSDREGRVVSKNDLP